MSAESPAAGPPRACRLRYGRWLRQAFVSDLGPRKWRRLREHLGRCEQCRAVYDRLGEMESVLSNATLMPPRVLDRLLTGLRWPAPERRRLARPWIAVLAAGSARR